LYISIYLHSNIVETFSGADHILRWLTILGVLLYACIIATLTLMGNLNEKDSNLVFEQKIKY